MGIELTIPKAAFYGTAVGSNADILSANIGIDSRAPDKARSIYRLQFKCSASAVVNVILKDTTGSVYGTASLNSGVQLAAGNLYGFVMAINNRTLYNFQTSVAVNLIGQIDEIQGVFI